MNSSSSSRGRGRIGINYPNPFFDLSQIYLPQNMRSLFKWCRYYALTYGPIFAFVTKMASYALTRLVWGSDAKADPARKTDQNLPTKWQEFFEDTLHIYKACYRGGLHYWTYGNWYLSVHYPFDRWLTCPKCRHEQQAKKFPKKGYRWHSYKFHGRCPSCESDVAFKVKDVPIRSAKRIKIKIWNPERVYPVVNEATDDVEYYYKPTESLLKRIRRGDRKVIETTPWPFIQAARKDGMVKFNNKNFLHISAPSPDGNETGMGHPPILAAIKDIFHLQLMKRAQEANAVERCVPLTVVHPLPMGDRSINPLQTANLTNLLDFLKDEVAQTRKDPNYIPFSPLPVGTSHIWGEGKNLLLVPEIRGWTEIIAADLAVPIEFMFGGMQWSGSNVSLRMLENQILTFTAGYRQVTRFVSRATSRFLHWPECPHDWTPFKMADDIQLKQHMLMLSQMNKIGDSTLLSHFGKNPSDEKMDIEASMQQANKISREQLRVQSEAQIEAMEMQQTAQMQMQMQGMSGLSAEAGAEQQVGAPGMGGMGGAEAGVVPVEGEESQEEFAYRMAQQLATQPDQVVQQALQSVAEQSPELAQYIMQLIQQIRAESQQQPQQDFQAQQPQVGGFNQASLYNEPNPPEQQLQQQYSMASQQMMQPLPQARAPHRSPASAAI